MKSLIASIIVAFMVAFLCAASSCAPRAVIVEPIAPKAAHLQAATNATTTAAKRVNVSVVNIQAKSTDLRATLAQGMLEAERIRKTGLADQTFLDTNADRWQEANVKIGLLEAMTQSATIDSKELTAAAIAASTEAGELATETIAHDKGVEKLKTEIVAQADSAALGKQLKRSAWIVAILIILGAAAWLFIKLAQLVIQAAKPL